MATADNIWTPTTLARQIRGELNADPDAAGGDVPDRLVADCKTAYRELWELYQWRFRRKRGSLTVAESADTVALPADYEQMDMRWLEDSSNDTNRLTITLDEEVFEAYRTRNDNREGGPEIAILEPAEDLDAGYSEILRIAPSARQEFVFDIVYYKLAPELADDGNPLWPPPFYLAWEFLARAKAYYSYKAGNDAGDKPWRHAMGIIERLQEKNDPPTRTPVMQIRDDVGDVRATTSFAFQRGGIPTNWGGNG